MLLGHVVPALRQVVRLNRTLESRGCAKPFIPALARRDTGGLVTDAARPRLDTDSSRTCEWHAVGVSLTNGLPRATLRSRGRVVASVPGTIRTFGADTLIAVAELPPSDVPLQVAEGSTRRAGAIQARAGHRAAAAIRNHAAVACSTCPGHAGALATDAGLAVLAGVAARTTVVIIRSQVHAFIAALGVAVVAGQIAHSAAARRLPVRSIAWTHIPTRSTVRGVVGDWPALPVAIEHA